LFVPREISKTVPDLPHLRNLRGRTWVTRKGIHVDRIASRMAHPPIRRYGGHSRDEARALIQKTHVNPDAPPHAKKHAAE